MPRRRWRGATGEFTYTVENHRFSGYAADVEVSFRHNDAVIAEPVAGTLAAGAFAGAEMKWTLDADALVPADYPEEQSYIINLLINRDGVRREVIVNVSGLPAKPVIVESRPVD